MPSSWAAASRTPFERERGGAPRRRYRPAQAISIVAREVEREADEVSVDRQVAAQLAELTGGHVHGGARALVSLLGPRLEQARQVDVQVADLRLGAELRGPSR